MKKVAVILSGCGVYDGSEIHEAVLTLLALARAGAQVTCAAPNARQAQVIDHSTGTVIENAERNILQEAARISRGDITPLDTLDPTKQDAIIFVGGFGAAKNLSNLAFKGTDYTITPEISTLIQKAHAHKIALGFICIAPALAAAALGSQGIQLTIGNDNDTAASLEHKGAQHINCTVDDIVTDASHRIVTTPAYMLASDILEAEVGINKLVAKVLELC
jgi:enhancing lycopene biosynthesis protein 2